MPWYGGTGGGGGAPPTPINVPISIDQAYNVQDYGAVGDGVTDDTAEIQACIDEAEAFTVANMRGATVYFPMGMYNISSTLRVKKDGIVLEGYARAGSGNAAVAAEATLPVTSGSILRPTSAFSGDWIIDVSTDATPKVRALVGNWIKNLAMDCWSVPAGPTGGIFFQSFRGGILWCHITRLSENTVATGPGIEFRCVDDLTVWAKGVWDCIFHGNVIQSCVGPCFYAPSQASDSFISENIIQASQSAGLDLNGPGFVVVGNYITGNSPGVLCEGRENYFVGNRFRECNGGIKIAQAGVTWGGDWLIVGNSFRNCSQGGDGVNDLIEISNTTAQTGGIISGNNCSTLGAQGGYRPRYFVNITNANAVDVQVGHNGASYITGAPYGYTSPFGAGGGFLNDLGTNTRVLSGHKIRVLNTDGTESAITAESTATTSTAKVEAIGKRADGTVIPVKMEAGSDGRIRIGSTANLPVDFIQTSGAKMTMNTSGDLAFGAGTDLSFDTATGSMLGITASQKLSLWGATPIVQPSATGETVGFTAGAGTAVNDQSTFTGNVGTKAYRISDIVKALKQAGVLASS